MEPGRGPGCVIYVYNRGGSGYEGRNQKGTDGAYPAVLDEA